MEAYQWVKQNFLKYWFFISSAALAIFYILFDRRGRQLEEAKIDAQTAILGQKLADIKSRSIRSDKDYEKATNDYRDLRKRHGALLRKLNIGDISERDN